MTTTSPLRFSEPWLELIHAATSCDDAEGALKDPDTIARLALIVKGKTRQIEDAITSRGLTRKTAREVVKLAQEQARQTEAEMIKASARLEQMVPPDEYQIGTFTARLPPAYEFQGRQIWQGEDMIADIPIGLVERYEVAGATADAAPSVLYRVAWDRGGDVLSAVIPGEHLRTARTCTTALGRYGAPVTPSNAAKLIALFNLQDLAIADAHPLARTCGWLHGDPVFALPSWSAQDGPHAVQVEPIPECTAQARAYRSRGTWGDYLTTLAKLDAVPEAWGAIYAACAPVLMVPVGTTMGCMLSLAADSGSGKTRILMVAAATWGRPSSDGMISNWNTTTAGLEQLLEFSDSTCVFMDETQQARSLSQVTECLYQTANGGGRNRYTSSRASFHTMIVTTGEQSLMSLTTERGAQNRILEYGLPHDGRPAGYFFPSADICDDVTAGVQDNFGHLGPRFAQHVAGADWSELRRAWRGHAVRYRDRGLDTRLADLLGLLALAADLIHGPLGVPRPGVASDPVELLAYTTAAARQEHDAEADALQLLQDAAASMPPKSHIFEGRQLTDDMRQVVDSLTYSEARQALARHGIPKPQAMCRRLEDRGMIKVHRKQCVAGVRNLSWVEFV
jgi:hypothetical protein